MTTPLAMLAARLSCTMFVIASLAGPNFLPTFALYAIQHLKTNPSTFMNPVQHLLKTASRTRFHGVIAGQFIFKHRQSMRNECSNCLARRRGTIPRTFREHGEHRGIENLWYVWTNGGHRWRLFRHMLHEHVDPRITKEGWRSRLAGHQVPNRRVTDEREATQCRMDSIRRAITGYTRCSTLTTHEIGAS